MNYYVDSKLLRVAFFTAGSFDWCTTKDWGSFAQARLPIAHSIPDTLQEEGRQMSTASLESASAMPSSSTPSSWNHWRGIESGYGARGNGSENFAALLTIS